MIRLEGKEFPTPVTFGEDGEQNLLGAMALEDAMLAVDRHSRRLITGRRPGDDQHGRVNIRPRLYVQ